MEDHQKTPENREEWEVKQMKKKIPRRMASHLHIIAKMATWTQGKWLYFVKTDFMVTVKLFAFNNVFSTIKTDDNIRFESK